MREDTSLTVESTSCQGNNGLTIEMAPISSRNPAKVSNNGYMQKQNSKHLPCTNIYVKNVNN